MTQQQLSQISSIQLQIMDQIHELCVKHSITYYMIAGTLLGAVRHKGFIPWDLDIDIAMPRPEYERFKAVCREELTAPYAYVDLESSRRYPRPHALVVRSDTRVKLKYDHLNPKTMDLGVYLDIFPLDNAPDEEALREKQAKALLRLRKFKSWRLPYSYSYAKWKRWAHYAVSTLLSWVSIRKINIYQQKLMCQYNGQATQCLCSMASQYAYKKQCMSRQIYGTPVLLEFEGRQYYAPEQYKTYLTQLYGDYMQLPPVEERQANLEFYTSLEFL